MRRPKFRGILYLCIFYYTSSLSKVIAQNTQQSTSNVESIDVVNNSRSHLNNSTPSVEVIYLKNISALTEAYRRRFCSYISLQTTEKNRHEGQTSQQTANLSRYNMIGSAIYSTEESLTSTAVDDTNYLPDGCHFKDQDIHTEEIICSGSDMTQVPFFELREIDSLTFDCTGIQILNASSIALLPRTNRLTFSNGVLMAVDFGELLERQEVMATFSTVNNRIATFSFSRFAVNDEEETGLKTLDMEDNLIMFLPEPSVDEKSTLHFLETINFNHNPITVLPGNLFSPLRDSPVKELFLGDTQLLDIGRASRTENTSPLVYLPRLEVLDISKNPRLPISKLEILLSPLTKLHSLSLASNFYIEVPTKALKKVNSSLSTLDLQDSSLVCLDRQSFPKMGKLKTLNLRSSRISSIEEKTFNSLPNLEILHLDGNTLLTIPPASELPMLKVLTLEENPTGLTNHEVFKISESSLACYRSLENLSLSKDPIMKIQNNDFYGLESLLSLNLSACSIDDIESYSFSCMTSLEVLDLSGNNIQSLAMSTFSGLSNVKHLDLSSNKIVFHSNSSKLSINPFSMEFKSFDDLAYSNDNYKSRIPKYPFEFTEMKKLITLNLYNNLISHLYSNLFQNLEPLQVLDLSQNRIKSWNKPVFSATNNLHLVLLGSNDITHLTDAMIQDFSKPHLTVDLSNNLFVCSCSLMAIKVELNNTNFINETSYQCFNGTNIMLVEDYIALWNDTACINSKGNHYRETFTQSKLQRQFHILGILTATVVFVSIIVFASYKNRWLAMYLAHIFKAKLSQEEELGNYEYDTFVCYSNSDREWVFEKLIRQLESTGSGLSVCVHERDFLVGEEITRNIIRSVEISRKVIVVISRSFVRSSWCMFELQIASNKIVDEKKSKLILVLLEPIPSAEQTKELKILLKSKTYISWAPDQDGTRIFYTRLMRAISRPSSLNTMDQETRQSESSTSSLTDEESQLSISSITSSMTEENILSISSITSSMTEENILSTSSITSSMTEENILSVSSMRSSKNEESKVPISSICSSASEEKYSLDDKEKMSKSLSPALLSSTIQGTVYSALHFAKINIRSEMHPRHGRGMES